MNDPTFIGDGGGGRSVLCEWKPGSAVLFVLVHVHDCRRLKDLGLQLLSAPACPCILLRWLATEVMLLCCSSPYWDAGLGLTPTPLSGTEKVKFRRLVDWLS